MAALLAAAYLPWRALLSLKLFTIAEKLGTSFQGRQEPFKKFITYMHHISVSNFLLCLHILFLKSVDLSV